MSPGKSNKLSQIPGKPVQPLATVDEFCEYAGITPGAAAQLRYIGRGPKFVKVSGRQVRYRWEDIEAWVAERTFTRTDERPVGA
ncbi:helix-turn-helix transcriptional regulator [Mycobacterium persicum]|uniref:helix-turn-helix transcriptional regulator n=1 Tax=Mycobacterium persicum TaxID=1487726 RepID=UPI000A0A8876|nr:helix-turn-helix domain-containing protein [Mycobacterium persicum]ORC02207.1 hypothetical protein B1T48_14000 [Mycobacterium persicum]